MQSPGRNSPCPCGSGKKAKHCCHRLASGEQRAAPAGTVEAQCARASTLLGQGRLQEAVDGLSAALAERPDFAPASFALAQALWQQGRLDLAAERLRFGLRLQPQVAEAHNNLGILYNTLGRYEAAVESFHRALELKPDYAWAHCNLGNSLHDQGNSEAALESYRRALGIDPRHVESYTCLGNVLQEQGDVDAALANYRQALSLRPGDANAELGLGSALQARSEIGAATAAFRRALAAQPERWSAYDGLLFCLNIDPAIAAAERLAEARRYGRVVAAQANPYVRWAVDRAAGATAPLRVGLVSGDLRAHPVGFFIESLLAQLDPARVELYAYATLPQEDALTARIKPRFARWKSIGGESDAAAAAGIHGDGVHILIDLSGHTAHNRLPLLAWRPAPVQATWLGYFATTGVAAIDFLIADRVSVPDAARDQFTEEVCYLPDSRFCFTPPADDTPFPISALPALRNDGVTFGSFQNFLKLNDDVLASWGRILRALPRARLRIQNASMRYAGTREDLLARLAGAGVAADRVSLFGAVSRADYLQAHAEVDIILDTFPYTGATTTCEALWMGVPTLTRAGDTLVSRQGTSLLECAGLPEWVATDADDYVARATALAADTGRLARLRSHLRGEALGSPLFDATRFARGFEETLVTLWQRKRP